MLRSRSHFRMFAWQILLMFCMFKVTPFGLDCCGLLRKVVNDGLGGRASFSHSEAGCWKVRRKWSLSAENGRSEPQIARRGAVCQSNPVQDAQGDFGRTAAPGPRVGMAYDTVVAGHST